MPKWKAEPPAVLNEIEFSTCAATVCTSQAFSIDIELKLLLQIFPLFDWVGHNPAT
jgi:hypothetical protein